MFSNHYSQNLDGKGRLVIPPGWRTELGASIIVTRGLDPCLLVFPAAKFKILARWIEEIGVFTRDARTLSRYLCAQAISLKPDRHGRISISEALRLFAGIDDRAVIVGANDRIEIWNPGRFADQDNRTEAEVGAIAERIDAALQSARAATAAAPPRRASRAVRTRNVPPDAL